MLYADFLVIHLPSTIQRIFLAFGYMLGAVFFLMIITGGLDESVRSFTEGEYEGEGAIRVPSWPARWTVMINLRPSTFHDRRATPRSARDDIKWYPLTGVPRVPQRTC